MTKKWTAETALIQILTDAGKPMSIPQIYRAVVALCKRDGSKIPSIVTVKAKLYSNKTEFAQTAPGIYKVRTNSARPEAADSSATTNARRSGKRALTTKEAAKRVLEEAREPMIIREICDAAIGLGWGGNRAHPYQDMAKMLSRDVDKKTGTFKAIGKGYGLRKIKYGPNVFYVLKHPVMKDYFKIGITNNLRQRIKILSGTAVPLPFNIYYAAKCKDPKKFEDAFKKRYKKRREMREGDTEFFKDITRWDIKSLANKLREEIGIKKEIRKDEQIHLLD